VFRVAPLIDALSCSAITKLAINFLDELRTEQICCANLGLSRKL
jgi:hypothetical protein